MVDAAIGHEVQITVRLSVPQAGARLDACCDRLCCRGDLSEIVGSDAWRQRHTHEPRAHCAEVCGNPEERIGPDEQGSLALGAAGVAQMYRNRPGRAVDVAVGVLLALEVDRGLERVAVPE